METSGQTYAAKPGLPHRPAHVNEQNRISVPMFDRFHDDSEVKFESYYTPAGRRVIVCPTCAAPRSRMHVNEHGHLVCDDCLERGVYTSFTLIIWDDIEEADEVNRARRDKVMAARRSAGR